MTVTVNPLLTAQFENAPVNHDRVNSFSVVLRFSENVELNSNAFSNGLLTITNGMLLFHGQLTEGSNIAWRFDVKPPDRSHRHYHHAAGEPGLRPGCCAVYARWTAAVC